MIIEIIAKNLKLTINCNIKDDSNQPNLGLVTPVAMWPCGHLLDATSWPYRFGGHMATYILLTSSSTIMPIKLEWNRLVEDIKGYQIIYNNVGGIERKKI